jgi:hypothetical protein
LRKGIIEIPFGESWLKWQTIGSGIVPLRQYQPALKELIESGRAKPSFVVDKELRIEDAPEAYKGFSDHDFIKSVIRFDDGKNGSLIDEEESEGRRQRKRSARGMERMLERRGTWQALRRLLCCFIENCNQYSHVFIHRLSFLYQRLQCVEFCSFEMGIHVMSNSRFISLELPTDRAHNHCRC